MTIRALFSGVILLAIALSGCTTDTLSGPQDDDQVSTNGESPEGNDDPSTGGDTMTDDGDANTTGGSDPEDGGDPDEDGGNEPDAAQILFVDATATGAGTGTDWSNAFTRLQDALVAAEPGMQIRVAQGRYQPADAVDRDASFTMATGVQVFGGYAGLSSANADDRHINAFETVLTGDLLDDDGAGFTNTADNVRHVITVNAGMEDGVLDGFTISGGFADGPSSDVAGQGGGLRKVSGHFTLRDCQITGNYATIGGGARNAAGSLTMVNCSVRDNQAQLTGGGLYAAAGTLTVVNTELQRNHAPNGGGGLYAVSGATNLYNVAFVGNSTDFDGGGLYVQDGTVQATNVAVTANQVNRNGGGIFVLGGTCTLTNCIVWANLAGSAGLAAQIDMAAGSLTATHTCVGDEDASDFSIPFGGLASRNLDDDPRFLVPPDPGDDGAWDGTDDAFGDLGLWPDSPCIDAGDTAALPLDTADADGDADTEEALPIDMVGNTRVRSAAVDLGPHES